MPYLSITSNQLLETQSGQLEALSKMVATALGKPESYVMVELQHNPDMLFAGSNTPPRLLPTEKPGPAGGPDRGVIRNHLQ